MNSITTLPIPDSTVSPLQWGTNPDPSDQNSDRVFLTVDLLKWMNDNGRLLCDGSIRWRAQEVIKTYEG